MTTEMSIALGATQGKACRAGGRAARAAAAGPRRSCSTLPPTGRAIGGKRRWGPGRVAVRVWGWPLTLFALSAGPWAYLTGAWRLGFRGDAEPAAAELGCRAGAAQPTASAADDEPSIWSPGTLPGAIGATGLAVGLFGLLRARAHDRRRADEQAEVLGALTQIAASLATQADPLAPTAAPSAAAEPRPEVDAATAVSGDADVAVGGVTPPTSLAAAVREGFGHHLVELAEASRRLLRMDRAGVLLLDAPADTLELLADAGDMPPDRPQTYPLAELPACRRALDSGEPIFGGSVATGWTHPSAALSSPPAAAAAGVGNAAVAADAANGPSGSINRQMLATFRAGSVVLIPLVVRGEKVGLLTVSATAPRSFADADRQLVRTLASQAALILTQARLSAGMAAALADQRWLARQRDAAAKQRDALWAVTAAAFEAATLRESLDRIVELAPPALGVRRCTIAEATGRPDELRVVATTGGWAAGRSAAPFSGAGRPGGRALATGLPVVVQYARDDLGAVPWPGGAPPPPGGRVYLPLLRNDERGEDGSADAARRTTFPAGRPVNGHAIPVAEAGPRAYGVMGLTRDQPGPFDPEQLALAQAFAARAAAAIERARLRERTEDLLRQTNTLLARTRQDAADRATLLKELNHRVKNNLAGIVGLLTARPPGLDRGSPAWAWLDRVADRVRTMGEAHELFVGGTTAVSLSELVGRVVRSLPMPEGRSIGVKTDLDHAGSVMFETGRAVGFAMVLHELCFNALAHGLGRGGTLTVTGRLTTMPPAAAPGSNSPPGGGGPVSALELTVADDGSAPDHPAEAAGRPGGTGLGLTLVRELVGRELRGTFSLGPRDPRGTVARVTFPLPVPPAEPVPPSAAAGNGGLP